jgi:hypothetical protein
LLAPLGEDIETDHALLILVEEHEDTNLLIVVGYFDGPRFVDEFFEGTIGILSSSSHERGWLHCLFP